jgi:WD domain, G-beta repeat
MLQVGPGQPNVARMAHVHAPHPLRDRPFNPRPYAIQRFEFLRRLPLTRPYLVPAHPLPDLPSSSLQRTLRGHTDRVWGCAISADGQTIVSASLDQTLKVWDAASGHVQCTLYVDTSLRDRACAATVQRIIAVGAWYVYMLLLRV